MTGGEGGYCGLYGLRGLGAFDETDLRSLQSMEPQEVVKGLDRQVVGLPAVISANVVASNKTAVDIDGDTSSNTTARELATASQYGAGVEVLVLNNGFQVWYCNGRASSTRNASPTRQYQSRLCFSHQSDMRLCHPVSQLGRTPGEYEGAVRA
ncbi:hypothetical protein P691DRAFT_764841 [Macrolepiota fuliginosa MF-IS2]|uniref:Thiamine pyrophosphate enzyme TPP-binding domain-containing protein n=1 Tax=Macrolepiota fuliginosa MF-IS2 TaxID=1400762 RepID=A0A9P5X391_9AGAR|nr:hypothetical protein P691DRAFT_764841 [Macrolepiota fuliginosa MF-IS2]